MSGAAKDTQTGWWFSPHGCRMEIEFKDGCLKAYAHPLDADGNDFGIVSFGLQGTPRMDVSEAVVSFVADFLVRAKAAVDE